MEPIQDDPAEVIREALENYLGFCIEEDPKWGDGHEGEAFAKQALAALESLINERETLREALEHIEEDTAATWIADVARAALANVIAREALDDIPAVDPSAVFRNGTKKYDPYEAEQKRRREQGLFPLDIPDRSV